MAVGCKGIMMTKLVRTEPFADTTFSFASPCDRPLRPTLTPDPRPRNVRVARNVSEIVGACLVTLNNTRT
eukprot:SAG11_NODE_2569_length_3213_cov_1.421002_3_plen_70_part_00